MSEEQSIIDIELCQELNIILINAKEDVKYKLAANRLLENIGSRKRVVENKEGYNVMHNFLMKLLNDSRYREAASLLWSSTKFSPEPFHCKEVFRCIEEFNQLIILGSSSSSKTYSAGVFFLLDWYRDPEFTKIYCISINAEHLVRNLFGHITDLFNSAAIKLKGKAIGDRYIGTDTKEGSLDKKNCGLMGVIFPQNYSASSGRMKGMKPGNRDQPHPVFGAMGRTRVLIDEAQNVPSSIFEDLPSVLAGANEIGSVKVIISGNPEAYALPMPFGYMSEPVNGWESLDIDRDKEWESRYGYHVLRLDANDSENIKCNKVVYEGLQTPTGYRAIQQSGGEKYLTFCRGIFPFSSIGNIVLPKHQMMKQIGIVQWKGSYQKIASADIAFRNDKVVLSIGGYGKAIGVKTGENDFEPFMHEGKRVEKMVLQVFNQFTIEDIDDDIKLAKKLIEICIKYDIPPDNFVSDATGTGSGVYSYMRNYWGDTLGLVWGESATEHKVFLEDEKTAEEQYSKISDEMWYANADWVKNGVIYYAPNVSEDLIFELTTRKQAKTRDNGKQKVETKDDYKSRNQGRSPDCFIQGTMISTANGDMPIELIEEGDYVCTPFGNKKVIVTHKNKCKKEDIFEIKTKDGSTLCGKGKHKIYVDNEGWVRLDSILQSHQLSIYNESYIWKILNLLFTKKENIGFKHLVNIIKTGEGIEKRDFFIESSGLSIMEIFLKAMWSTIKMGIGEIATSPILKLWKDLLTQKCIIKSCAKTRNGSIKHQSGLRKQGKQLKNGIDLKKEENGIKVMLKTLFSKKGSSTENARTAENNSNGKDMDLQESSAPIHAGIKKAWKTQKPIKDLVCLVVQSLWHLGGRKKKLVAENAQQSSWLTGDTVTVYNLTLESENVYYANGFLVQNCADSSIQLQQLVRMRFNEVPSMSPSYNKIEEEVQDYGGLTIASTVDEVQNLDFVTEDKEDLDNFPTGY